ncbi:hypothetical protein AAMO2058_000194700 [Amorphochlora amoebiformis]
MMSKKRNKGDNLSDDIRKWVKKCNNFEEHEFEYIEFEKLIELLMERAFFVIQQYERRKHVNHSKPNIRDPKKVLMDSKSLRPESGRTRRSMRPARMKRGLSFSSRSVGGRRVEEKERENDSEEETVKDTIWGQNCAAVFTLFESGGYIRKLFAKWMSRFKHSRITFEAFMDSGLREIVHICHQNHAPHSVLLKFFRFLASINEDPREWMEQVRNTRHEFQKLKKVVKKGAPLTLQKAATLVQKLWRGVRIRRNLAIVSDIQEQNKIWHQNRSKVIGQNIGKHYWAHELWRILTDRQSMALEQFEEFVDATPVDFSMRYNLEAVFSECAGSINGEIAVKDFHLIANLLLEKVYNQLDRDHAGYIHSHEATWLVEYLMGYRDSKKTDQIRRWLPERDGKVDKFHVVGFMKKYWLAVLSRNNFYQHKCFLGVLGTLLSINSVTALMPEQALFFARRKKALATLNRKIEKMKILKDGSQSKSNPKDPWGVAFDVGGNRSSRKYPVHRPKAREIAKRMLEDPDFIESSSFDQWEKLMRSTVGLLGENTETRRSVPTTDKRRRKSAKMLKLRNFSGNGRRRPPQNNTNKPRISGIIEPPKYSQNDFIGLRAAMNRLGMFSESVEGIIQRVRWAENKAWKLYQRALSEKDREETMSKIDVMEKKEEKYGLKLDFVNSLQDTQLGEPRKKTDKNIFSHTVKNGSHPPYLETGKTADESESDGKKERSREEDETNKDMRLPSEETKEKKIRNNDDINLFEEKRKEGELGDMRRLSHDEKGDELGVDLKKKVCDDLKPLDGEHDTKESQAPCKENKNLSLSDDEDKDEPKVFSKPNLRKKSSNHDFDLSDGEDNKPNLRKKSSNHDFDLSDGEDNKDFNLSDNEDTEPKLAEDKEVEIKSKKIKDAAKTLEVPISKDVPGGSVGSSNSIDIPTDGAGVDDWDLSDEDE